MGDAINIWNVIQHFYPYLDIITVNWSQILPEYLQKAYQDTSSLDFDHTLKEMIAKLEDGHAMANLRGETQSQYYPPIAWECAEGRLVITGVDFAKGTNLKPGDVIVKINDDDPKNLQV